MNENKLTKKECGRINSALNQSRLDLFDVKENLKSKELGEKVCSSMDRKSLRCVFMLNNNKSKI